MFSGAKRWLAKSIELAGCVKELTKRWLAKGIELTGCVKELRIGAKSVLRTLTPKIHLPFTGKFF